MEGKQVSETLKVCSPVLVVVGRLGKKRLVINLRYVNAFFQKQKIQDSSMKTQGQHYP